ncbi:putative methyltransferase, YaeB/AF_0241 family [Klebsiella pneumoniae]|uniref:Putative methyltransferase, YaeB/AF_0241 family n=1 Tax=Klebsiella pneumoniae TaxID=573 RepID=A0A2X3H3E3_KLEPN|nr:putative methyltransferase, YaeB/AF_0241 family [Klebsiella pneumoniae]
MASDGATLPRLGGNARMGVFATRSTFRPNPIGMSLVELKGIRCQKDQVILELGSLDLVDGTPVVDIKPYLPFAEALPDASASYAQQAPLAGMNVSFTPEIDAQFTHAGKTLPHISKRLSARCWRRIRVRPTEKRNKREKRMPSGCWISTSAGG